MFGIKNLLKNKNEKSMSMFCYQCQEAAKGVGCSIGGVCGKNPEVANLQDLLIYVCKGISIIAEKANEKGIKTTEADHFVIESLFVTITNANFDRVAITTRISAGVELRNRMRKEAIASGISESELSHDAVVFELNKNDDFMPKASIVGVLSTQDEDVRSLRELLVYGLKGMAAYSHHAQMLGFEDNGIYAFAHKALAATTNAKLGVGELIPLVLECGKFGVNVMALLDKANTTTYGNPEITKVNLGVRKNPAILVSGHDLKDLEELLKQTENTGVDVYTHSEMLPAHYYPAFKKYSNFVGNFGNAWWQQAEEFEKFNGPILMTTNCIVPPRASYRDRIWTTGAVGFEGVKHIADRKDGQTKDFSAIIAQAKTCPSPTEIETGEIVGGFAHAQVTALAGTVVDAVKSGAVKHFFVMAGCDGRHKERSYYTDFATAIPNDTIILTAGCAKYRYNKLPLGDIGGIPRVLDAGQCNDSYSLALIALKLKEAFGLEDINSLPVSYNIAWYEQKAVIVLLALLHLGVKNIHLGPTLPAFLSPNVAKVLIENFGIGGISNVEDDIRMFLEQEVNA